MTELEKYYNKHKEENRLLTRHGQVEFRVSLKNILDNLPKDKNPEDIKILDLGAGTGRYSVALQEMGYDVTAVELVQHNLDILRAKHTPVKTWKGDARNISFLDDETFDLTVFFGPLYHLHGDAEKLKAFSEAARVTKKGGIIMAGYVMNDYSLITYCFQENRAAQLKEQGAFSPDFHINDTEKDLYSYVRLEDLDRLNKAAGLTRIDIFAPDGAADYMRPILNAMTPENFELFVEFQMTNAHRPELLGAGSHIVDVLRKE